MNLYRKHFDVTTSMFGQLVTVIYYTNFKNFLKIQAIHYLIAKVCICSIQHFNQSKSKNFLFERKFYLRNVLQRSTTSDIQIYIMNLNYMHNHYHGEQFVEHVPGPLDRLSTSTKSLSTHKTYWMMRVWGCQFYISKKQNENNKTHIKIQNFLQIP